MIRRNPENGVEESGEASATPAELRWKGVRVRAFRRKWTTETRYYALASDQPTLYVILDEVGGRCELRASSAPVTMNYCGPQALGNRRQKTDRLSHPVY